MITLLIGLLVGFYARNIWEKLLQIQRELADINFVRKTGAVQPQKRLQTRTEPINLASKNGSIRKPTPQEVRLNQIDAADKAFDKYWSKR